MSFPPESLLQPVDEKATALQVSRQATRRVWILQKLRPLKRRWPDSAVYNAKQGVDLLDFMATSGILRMS